MSSSSSSNNVFQISYYVAINLENILYGIELVIYFKAMQILATRNQSTRKKSDIFYALFSTMMLLLVTIWIATCSVFGEEMWLVNNDYPGGPNAFWQNNISVWYMDLGTTAAIVLQLMTDGLMIYRCRVIWNSNRAIIIPVIIWLSTLVLGILVDWSSSLPGGNFFTGIAAQLGLSYYSVTVFLNTLLTCMICFRLLRHGKMIRESGLGREYASPYYAIAAIVVESMIPYSLSGIAFLISFGIGSPTSTGIINVYILMMCLSPQMLILRVILGSAWDKNTCVVAGSTLKLSGPQCKHPVHWTDGSSSGVDTQQGMQMSSHVQGLEGNADNASSLPV